MASLSKSELKKMQSNYDHMLQSPIVQKLNKKVSKLKKENRILNRLLLHLGKSIEQRETHDLTEESDSGEEHIVYSIEEKSPKRVDVKEEILNDSTHENVKVIPAPQLVDPVFVTREVIVTDTEEDDSKYKGSENMVGLYDEVTICREHTRSMMEEEFKEI